MTTTLEKRLRLAMAGPPAIKPAALARACGIKQPSVSDWLSGRTKHLEGANLLSAAAYLNVTPEWLSSGRGPMRPADNLPPDDAAFVQYVATGAANKDLAEHVKQAIRTLIDSSPEKKKS